MRTYELVLVYDPALEVEQVETDLRKLNDTISANGVMRRWERWGKRRLAFEIKGRQYGYYVLAVYDSEPKFMAELERSVRLNPTVIRHLITVVEPKRVPEVDLESVRTLGAAPEPVTAPAEAAPQPEAAVNVIPSDSEVPALGSDTIEGPETLA
ncbi:MAG TPA: 30S ribosomal protein S6 [bacterium]|jgi:small subunit ribosomal protein S6